MARKQKRRHPAPDSFKQTLATLRLKKQKEGIAEATPEKKQRPVTRVKEVLYFESFTKTIINHAFGFCSLKHC
jgi:hypothetical protein